MKTVIKTYLFFIYRCAKTGLLVINIWLHVYCFVDGNYLKKARKDEGNKAANTRIRHYQTVTWGEEGNSAPYWSPEALPIE